MNELKTVRSRTRKIIMEMFPHINPEDITDESGLISEGLLDSLGFLTLAIGLQQEFAIEIPFDMYTPEEFTTFGKLVLLCEAAVANKTGGKSY